MCTGANKAGVPCEGPESHLTNIAGGSFSKRRFLTTSIACEGDGGKDGFPLQLCVPCFCHDRLRGTHPRGHEPLGENTVEGTPTVSWAFPCNGLAPPSQ